MALLVIETDPETGMDKIVHVDPENVCRPQVALRAGWHWLSWDSFGMDEYIEAVRG